MNIEEKIPVRNVLKECLLILAILFDRVGSFVSYKLFGPWNKELFLGVTVQYFI
jgi:hypothetical protein